MRWTSGRDTPAGAAPPADSAARAVASAPNAGGIYEVSGTQTVRQRMRAYPHATVHAPTCILAPLARWCQPTLAGTLCPKACCTWEIRHCECQQRSNDAALHVESHSLLLLLLLLLLTVKTSISPHDDSTIASLTRCLRRRCDEDLSSIRIHTYPRNVKS